MMRRARYAVCDFLTAWLLKLLRVLNPYKDNGLSQQLHDIADEYDTRPTGEWR